MLLSIEKIYHILNGLFKKQKIVSLEAIIDLTINEKNWKGLSKEPKKRYHYSYICPDIKSRTCP